MEEDRLDNLFIYRQTPLARETTVFQEGGLSQVFRERGAKGVLDGKLSSMGEIHIVFPHSGFPEAYANGNEGVAQGNQT